MRQMDWLMAEMAAQELVEQVFDEFAQEMSNAGQVSNSTDEQNVGLELPFGEVENGQ